jgi:hypothetical protein
MGGIPKLRGVHGGVEMVMMREIFRIERRMLIDAIYTI